MNYHTGIYRYFVGTTGITMKRGNYIRPFWPYYGICLRARNWPLSLFSPLKSAEGET